MILGIGNATLLLSKSIIGYSILFLFTKWNVLWLSHKYGILSLKYRTWYLDGTEGRKYEYISVYVNELEISARVPKIIVNDL